jgi:tyrosyl-tRNA synthetase
VYLNGERVASATEKLASSRTLYGRYAMLRKGKKNYAMLTVS